MKALTTASVCYIDTRLYFASVQDLGERVTLASAAIKCYTFIGLSKL